ncbi:hypothetical protein SAMN05660964_02532 [Thiothrix caldifontis]|uniref:Uncharacterized protein n=1 Tax=Thiothrix caldifontis TaxID=525918 RepID=A0A1H4EA04_9GAMM|nr:hypothetical protein SAMN05660964_02532 [Thiothrix caldifontis]
MKRVNCLIPRMLTVSEIKLLRQSKAEIAKRVSELVHLKAENAYASPVDYRKKH